MRTASAPGVHVEGLQEALNALSRLDRKARRRVLTKAIRAGAKEQRKVARSEAPSDTGQLRKQLRTSVKRDRTKGSVTATLKLKRTKGQREKGVKDRQSVLRFIVEGTPPHKIPGPVRIGTRGTVVSNVDHPGAMANPFMDRAVRRSQSAAIKMFQKTFGPALEAEARKGAT